MYHSTFRVAWLFVHPRRCLVLAGAVAGRGYIFTRWLCDVAAALYTFTLLLLPIAVTSPRRPAKNAE